MRAEVNINNVPEDTERYIVARIVEGEMWYWGSWKEKHDAETTAKEIDGIVIEKWG